MHSPSCDYLYRQELYLFLLTFARFEASRPLYLLADEPTSHWLGSSPQGLDHLRPPHILPFPTLCPDAGTAVCDGPLAALKKKQRAFIVLQRMVPMEVALREGHRGVLALDSDYILLQPLPAMGPQELGLMPSNAHFKRMDRAFGRYSGGLVFARRPEVLAAWREEYANSRYFDQAALEPLELEFQYFLIGPSNNINFQHTEQRSARHGHDVGRFSIRYPTRSAERLQRNGTVMWQAWSAAPIVPLRSLHVHLLERNRSWWLRFVNQTLHILRRSTVRDEFCLAYPELCHEYSTRQNEAGCLPKCVTNSHMRF